MMSAAILGLMLAAPPEMSAAAPRRLSEAEVAAVLADAARKREAVEAAAPPANKAIHGEVGVSVGTGGYRAAYGTAVVPLGGESQAIISVSTETRRDHYRGRVR